MPSTPMPSPQQSSALPQQRRVLSVQQLNRRARQILEQLPLVWVEGELSNVSVPASGHVYFSLKDSHAQIRCALFRPKAAALSFRPQPGQNVVVRGQLSLFEGRGDYQLIIEYMELVGNGALQQQLDMLKRKLQAEGLLDPQRKQAIPKHPLHIGVITSPTGAAIRDVLTVLQRRFPSIPVTVVPTSVQGQGAPAEIVRAIHLAEMSGLFDVLLVTRGGGSLEDLWAFNDELVARAIAACPIPTVSAVGHETDITLADWVADHRAPTPSAGAELLSPDRSSIARQLQEHHRQLFHRIAQRVEQEKQQLLHLRKRLRHPQDDLRQQSQRLDLLEIRLKNAIQTQLQALHLAQTQLTHALTQHNPQQRVDALRQRLSLCSSQLPKALSVQMGQYRQSLQHIVQRLNSVNPLAVLERGYAIAYHEPDMGSSLTGNLDDKAQYFNEEKQQPNEEKQQPNEEKQHSYKEEHSTHSPLSRHAKDAVNADTATSSNTIITQVSTLKKGDWLRIRFHEGEALCSVEAVMKNNDNKMDNP